MGDSGIGGDFRHPTLRGGAVFGQDTPETSAIEADFASKGMPGAKAATFGAKIEAGADLYRVSVARGKAMVTFGTEAEVGVLMQNAVSAVPNMPDGYLYKGHRQELMLAPALTVGVERRFDNGLDGKITIRTAQNIIACSGTVVGFRAEAGNRLGGYIEVNHMVCGVAAGDTQAGIGVTWRLNKGPKPPQLIQP